MKADLKRLHSMEPIKNLPGRTSIKADIGRLYELGLLERPRTAIKVDIEKLYELGMLERPEAFQYKKPLLAAAGVSTAACILCIGMCAAIPGNNTGTVTTERVMASCLTDGQAENCLHEIWMKNVMAAQKTVREYVLCGHTEDAEIRKGMPDVDRALNVHAGLSASHTDADITTGTDETSEIENTAAVKTVTDIVMTTGETITVSDDQINMLAAIIWCEAGNQCYEGQVSVGAVVMNRVKSGDFPDTIPEVIRQDNPIQFSPVGSGKFDRAYNAGSWSESSYKAALDALEGISYVGDALYFKNPALAGAHSGITIEDHVFW